MSSASTTRASDVPSELIYGIVELASYPDLWGKESPVPWLKSISTLSKVWRAASQRMIFYEFRLGVSASDPTSEGEKQIRYLEFLESRPDLAAYIVCLNLFSPVLPAEEATRRLSAALPNIKRATIDVAGTRIKSAPLTALITGFVHLESLTLIYPWSFSVKGTAIRFYQRLAIHNMSILATCEAMAPILEALSASSSARTLNSLQLVCRSSSPAAFAQCRDAIAKLSNLRFLNILINEFTSGYEKFKDIDVSMITPPKLSVLRIHVLGVPDLTISVFRALLREAALPGVRDLELEIVTQPPRLAQQRMFVMGMPKPFFRPFGHAAKATEEVILSPALSGTLQKLQIGFEDDTIIQDSKAFFQLFSAQPSLLKIEGDGLKLQTGRP